MCWKWILLHLPDASGFHPYCYGRISRSTSLMFWQRGYASTWLSMSGYAAKESADLPEEIAAQLWA